MADLWHQGKLEISAAIMTWQMRECRTAAHEPRLQELKTRIDKLEKDAETAASGIYRRSKREAS